jgi:hypothetical protein
MESDYGAKVDSAEVVIRFNEPSQPPEKIGVKTDLLFLVNSGKSMQARLSNAAYLGSNLFQEARSIVLPYHPWVIATYHGSPNLFSRLKGRRADWTRKTIEVLGLLGKPVTVLPVSFYEQSCQELGIQRNDMRKVFPSTGLLGIRYALENFAGPDWRVEICGFGWTGWKRHDWVQERDWVAQRLEQQILHELR